MSAAASEATALEALRGLRIGALIGTDGPGGAERVFSLICRILAESGVEVVPFVPADGEGWLDQELEGLGIHHYPLRAGDALAQVLAEAFRRRSVRLIHCHMATAILHGAEAAGQAGIPFVVTIHGAEHAQYPPAKRRALAAACRASSGTCVVSPSLTPLVREDFGLEEHEVQVIPNGVRLRPRASSSLRDELGLEDAPLILNVGNLYPVKGQGDLLHALALLARERPSLRLAIAGRGGLEAPLMALAQTLGVAERVHWLGLRSDVDNLYAAADVFALASHSEGHPLSLLEAMTAAIPIVATEVGGVRETLEDGRCGVLVPASDPAAMAAAIDRLLALPEEAARIAERAARRAASMYRAEIMVRSYAELYARALRREV